MDFHLATVVRKTVLTKQVCLCHPTIQAVLGRSSRHVCRPPGKALYFPWKSLTAELQVRDREKLLVNLCTWFSCCYDLPPPFCQGQISYIVYPPSNPPPSEDKLWLGPDIPSNLLSQHRVKRARVLQRKPLCEPAVVSEETWHNRTTWEPSWESS
ncbi:unnamed protein product [Pleuronectes platessa]|uniref:Uncharacterized protein n=1 Tax=Pleuronectes platessa TaxID=8262 RepID=A0A9N7U4W2_PLEPL|nr:unnamed protein product [Pleuronectes platessa]